MHILNQITNRICKQASFINFQIGVTLRKQHVIVINRCCMYKKNWESVDHLLLHCEVACALWNILFNCFGLSWVIPSQIVDLFACWWTICSTRSAAVRKIVSSCLLCCFWREIVREILRIPRGA